MLAEWSQTLPAVLLSTKLENVNDTDIKYFRRMTSESRISYFIPFVNPPFLGSARKLIAVDLGLNVGSFPYVFSKSYSRIVSLEASSECISKAKLNLVGRLNIEYVHAAGGWKVGFQQIFAGFLFKVWWNPRTSLLSSGTSTS